MTTPTLSDSIQNPIVSDGVLSSLSPMAIHRLSLTCKVANEAVEDYRRRTWNIDNRLRRFFRDPLAFRILQARTDTVIHGLFVLEFFSRMFHPGTDLEICVLSQHVLEVGQWLMGTDNGGYSFQPAPNQDADFETNAKLLRVRNNAIAHDLDNAPTGVAAMFTFTSSIDDGRSARIQMSVAESSFFKLLFNASSTCTMNFITFNKACSLYPLSSFECYKSLITARDEEISKPVIQECRDWGWTLETEPDSDFSMCRRSRWVGDEFCWTVSLPVDSAPFSGVSHILPIELNGWFLTATRTDTAYVWPNKDWRACCIVMQSPGLKYEYVLPMTVFWADFIRQWTHTSQNSDRGDSSVRTHIEFCRRLSDSVDTVILNEQRSHHATVVFYREDLKQVKADLEQSQKDMKRKLDAMSDKLSDILAAVLDLMKKYTGVAEPR